MTPEEIAQAEETVKASVAMRFTAAGEEQGYKWRVQIIEAGPDKQGRVIYPYEVLKAAAPLYEGARVFALTEGQHTAGNNPYGKSVKDIVGWLSNVTSNDTGLEGDLNILKSAGWLRDMLTDAWAKGKTDLIALSHDVMGKTVAKGKAREAQEIVKVDSVDVVYDPVGGGKFLRMAAAAQAGQHKEDSMDWKRLLAALKTQRPDLVARIDMVLGKDDATENEITEIMAAAMAAPDLTEQITAAVKAATAGVTNGGGEAVKKAEEILKQARLTACSTTLSSELTASGLPEPVQNKIRKQYADKVFETETLRAAITEEKEVLDKVLGAGKPSGTGWIRDMQTEPERLQAAVDKLFGVDVKDEYKDVPAFNSLRTAYNRITGDSGMTGRIDQDHIGLGESLMQMMRLPAAYSTSSFSYVLGNSMYRRLVKSYQAVNYNEDILVSYFRNAPDFKTMEIVQIGYFGDLADVDPETADYAEIAMPSDVEATYSLNQKGNLLTITRRVILNDDLRSVVKLVDGLGRSARRTYAKRIWNKLISNATYKGDSKALFHADHANLGSTALTNDAAGVATLTARLQAMYAQTEPGSGEGLGLEALYLLVPRELLEIAKGLNSAWPGVAGGNPHAGRFGTSHERIITNPLLTDATDWYLAADGNACELLEVAHLNGQREPEMFTADNPAVGQMFVADKLQYKIRHEYEVEIADYRGFDKSVVAG